MPGVEDPHAVGLQRQREMQHGRACVRVVIDGAGDEIVAHRHAAAEDLPARHPPAAVDPLGLAGAVQPVRRASADQHQLLVDDTAQKARHRLRIAPPAPDQGGDQMCVHAQRKRGRSAVAGERAQHVRDVAIAGAAAAQFRGYECCERPQRLQFRVVLRHEGVVGVVGCGTGSEAWPRCLHQCHPIGAYGWRTFVQVDSRHVAFSSRHGTPHGVSDSANLVH